MEKLFDAVSAVYDLQLEEVTDGSLDELALRLDSCLRMKAMADDFAAAIKLQMAESMPEDDMVIQGVGVLHRKHRPRKTLKDKMASKRMRSDIAVAVARSLAEDRFTGEVDQAKRDHAAEAIDAVWAIVPSFSMMKRDGADSYGLDQDDYSDTSWSTTVELEHIEDEG